ncbi:MAG TPA: c-type cytochrome [Burkholderiaceae bacterium]|jgi:cytochrome c
MARLFYLSGAIALYFGMANTVFAAGDPIRGQALYQGKCGACHSIEYNGVGPAHMGVFNRKAGSRTDYDYSKAVKVSTIIWNEKTLDKWLTDPEKLIPGQKMGFLVPSKKDRADLIAYLKKATEEKK